MDDLTEIEDFTIFDLEPLPMRSYEKDYDTVMEISIERDLDLYVISREGYTLLDFFSDLGGMQGLLLTFFGLILNIWNYNYLEDFMVTRLFRLEKNSVQKAPDSRFFKHSEFMFSFKLDNPRAYIRECLPKCCTKLKICTPDRRT